MREVSVRWMMASWLWMIRGTTWEIWTGEKGNRWESCTNSSPYFVSLCFETTGRPGRWSRSIWTISRETCLSQYRNEEFMPRGIGRTKENDLDCSNYLQIDCKWSPVFLCVPSFDSRVFSFLRIRNQEDDNEKELSLIHISEPTRPY
mgnify:CR=1 FL=1